MEKQFENLAIAAFIAFGGLVTVIVLARLPRPLDSCGKAISTGAR